MAIYFLGACIGSITCAVYKYTWPARRCNVSDMAKLIDEPYFSSRFFCFSFQYICGMILAISCGFFFGVDCLTCFCIARFLAGFVYGFMYIVLMTHIGDNVMKLVRGFIAIDFSMWATLGMLLAVGFNIKTMTQFRWIFNVILMIISIVSITLTNFFTHEPITHLLRMDLEIEARTTLEKSQSGLFDEAFIQHEIDEKKLMLMEDYEDESQQSGFHRIFNGRNAWTIILMAFLRLLNLFTSNLYIYLLSATSMHSDMPFIMLIIIFAVRIIVLFIPKCSIDVLGRKNLLLVSGLGSGILLIPFAVNTMKYVTIRDDLLGLIIFSIHIFSALGIDPVQHIYASEAFALSKRNASLAIVTCMEYFLHATITILLLLEQKFPLEILLLISPFAVILLTTILFIALPETKALALRRCRDRFNKKEVRKPIQPPRPSLGIQTLGNVYM